MSLKLRGGVWHFRKTINGQIVSRSTKTGDKKLAEQIAAKIEHEAVKAIMFEGVKPAMLHEAIDAFLKARKGTGGYQNACTHMNHWKRLVPNKPAREVALYEVQGAIAKRREEGAAHNTLATFVGYWIGLHNFCKDQGWEAPLKVESIKSIKTRFKVLTKDEEERLFEAIDPNAHYRGKNPIKTLQRQDNWDLLICLLDVGGRKNELHKLKWSQVDFVHNLIHIKRLKGGVDSPIYMTKRVREVLQRREPLYRETGWVFPTKATRKTNTDWIRDAVKRAGIDESDGMLTLTEN
jgi:integrase